MNILKTRKFLILSLYILITFVLTLILSTALFTFLMFSGVNLTDDILNFSSLVLVVVTNIIFMLVSFYILKDVLVENWKRLKFSKQFFLIVIGTTISMFALSIVTSIIANSITGSSTPENQALIIDSLVQFPVLNLITIVVIAPIAEEFVFRFSMIRFSSKYKYVWLVVSSLIFGLMHIHGDFIFLIFYSLFGFVLGLIYLKTENIWYPIAIHFLNNSIGAIEMIVAFL